MVQDLITLVTPTIGDACGHLNRQMYDLRAFTRLPFEQIVSDDGTLDAGQRARTRSVCEAHGATCTENPGPVWGVGHNLNHAFSLVKTPWAFCVEDGLRPSYGWLETAVDAVRRVGDQTWCGHPVGMMGTASIQDWHLAMAGVLPGGMSWEAVNHKVSARAYSSFWGGAEWPNWNDGFWCWKRLMPGLRSACNSPEADLWPSPHPGFMRDLIRGQSLPEPHGSYADQLGYRPFAGWPGQRRAACGWFPGAFMLVNMEAWRKAGRFRDGCTFFEGHLGIRMAQHGYLSLCLDFPPWLHFEGMGFRNANFLGKRPRHHEPADGPRSIFLKDFGVDGPSHEDLYALVYQNFPLEHQHEINKELATVELWMEDGWMEWL